MNEIQVNLVKGICLHEHKVDHIAHLGPSIAAGLGSLLNLKTDVISTKPALFNMSMLPWVEKGSRTVFNDWVFAKIESGEYPFDNL